MKFIVFFILSITFFNCHASVTVFNHYQSANGLSESRIKAIVQDKQGFIWVGTVSGLFSFDGQKFVKVTSNAIPDIIDVQSLHVDANNTVWISTTQNGLLRYSHQQLEKVKSTDPDTHRFFEIASDANQQTWIATNKGVQYIDQNGQLKKPALQSLMSISNEVISDIIFINQDLMALSSLNYLYIIDIKKDTIQHIKVGENISEYIHDISYDQNNKIWIGTSNQLHIFDFVSSTFIKAPKLNNATRVLALTVNNDNMWVATIGGGLFRVNINDLQTQQHLYRKDTLFSLKENNIMALFISEQSFLWVGGFSKGLSALHLPSQIFNYHTNTETSLNCIKNSMINGIQINNEDIWISHESGLIKHNMISQSCDAVDLYHDTSENNTYIYSSIIDKDLIWLSTPDGLLKYNKKIGKTEKTSVQNLTIFFANKFSEDLIIFGSASGLYAYKISTDTFSKIESDNSKFNQKAFIKFISNNNGELYLPTNIGLLHLDRDLKLTEISSFSDQEILGVQSNHANELLVSVSGKGLYHLNSDYQVIHHFFDKQVFSADQFIYEIQFGQTNNQVWMTSNKGLIYLNLTTHQTQLFTAFSHFNYLSQSESSDKNNGILYFAGDSGYISFNPNDAIFNEHEMTVIIKQIYVMNNNVSDTTVITDESLADNINIDNNYLNFGHKDKLIGIEFVAPNFTHANKIKYAYKLSPIFNDWIELPQDEKRLTFTNLQHGKYGLSLKATNFKGDWSQNITSVGLNINPAPWRTWWAYIIYVNLIILTLYLLFRYRLKKAQQMNTYLNTQINKQTKHIQKQKEKLETLIARKDEIFANVTHEFKTPITLIKGPIQSLKNNEADHKKLDMLDMMQRNTNRLLTLVNQMLKLSEIVEETHTNKKEINIAEQISIIVEPYLFEAKKNDITFNLLDIDEVYVNLTNDALDIIIGNFILNAIKYTLKGGCITLGSCMKDNHIEIFVKDNGLGFDQKDKNIIFMRFGRLSQHQEIEGTGIGLALVKEVADLNNGIIEVKSEKGKGSYFSVNFKITEKNNVLKKSSEATVLSQQEIIAKTNNERETVLIIDDNKDMRNYIQQTLSNEFNCLLAKDGKNGMALALKAVPDIIICDVMMPGIDGFHVCRLLREDRITCHIPIVLLTALTQKSSRIKGWRENIDMYLNKPFDAQELSLQLRNILNIRSILNKKNYDDGQFDIKSQEAINHSEIDQEFLIKLKRIVTDKYKDPDFSLKSLAQAMFVSERQLQRKIKALIDVSPSDYIREFRLKNAVKLLKRGHQISIASDNSGFGSFSSFSQSFKKHYGMTPKEYQKLNKNG